MTRRPAMVAWGTAGGVWTLTILSWGYAGWGLPQGFPATLILGALPVGLVLAAMIGRLAQRRFFDDTIIDGQPFPPGSGAEIDQRVLTNTFEQALLAVLIWPAAGLLIAPAMPVALGLGFAVTRLAFWAGYHAAPHLRVFGFAGTFYPTVLAGLWAAWQTLLQLL